MTVVSSKLSKRKLARRIRGLRFGRHHFKLHPATLLWVGAIATFVALGLAWLGGEPTVNQFFLTWHHAQTFVPDWFAVPTESNIRLFWPTIATVGFVGLVLRLSPRPRPWSRPLVVGLVILLLLRYLAWRSLCTLNLNAPLNGIFSLGLLLLELLALTNGLLQLGLMVRVRDRQQEADQAAIAVHTGTYLPTVDILIPTYNEPAFILRRTVVGCQAIDYPHKRVYLLDDTRRPEIRALAAELGCEYLTRPDNRHAKAGNLNHAIAQTQGELITVFDADFIPTRNFLTRTVGFFQAAQIGLVQTPQSFYNTDPIAYNLGLETVLTPDEEVFYRQVQPFRDTVGSVVCAGTSFVVRRTALEAVGGFVTNSLSEDYFTGIQLAANGYQLVYLNEKLSAGLAADNMAAYALQRLRWGQGTLQAFFIKTNPLTIPGLTLLQRLGHLEGLLHWFGAISRLGFLLMPLAYAFLHVIPIQTTAAELVYFFLPYYGVQLATFAWLNDRSRSALLADVYSLVLAFPIALTVFQTMLNPFAAGFKVTPKGRASDRYTFNWNLGLPLLILFGLTLLSLWQNLGLAVAQQGWFGTASATFQIETVKGTNLGWAWSAYNLAMLGLALLILFDAPRQSVEWFPWQQAVQVTGLSAEAIPQRQLILQGQTIAISESGAVVELAPGQPGRSLTSHCSVELYLEDIGLTLPGYLQPPPADTTTVQIEFAPLTTAQSRRLIEWLYCRPGQWQRRTTPNELHSLWLLGKTLVCPPILSAKSPSRQAIAPTRPIGPVALPGATRPAKSPAPSP